MEKEHIDPIYEYVDEKLKLIKHDLEQALLKTQRHIAAFIITSTTENTILTLRKLKTREADNFIDQLIASASVAKTKANKSKTPLSIAQEWHSKCYDTQEQFGVKIIHLA